MNKCKKALTLLIGASAVISMSACSNEPVVSKANTLLSYITSDGETRVDFTTNELLLNYFNNNTASTQDLYDVVYEAMLKKYYNDPAHATELEEIEAQTRTKVEDKKEEAQDNADTNQTDYDDEWKSILDTELSDLRENKRTEEALYDKYLVENMQEDIGNRFYDNFQNWNEANFEEGTEEYNDQQTYNIFWGENGYLEKRIPYHVSHILVNVDAASNTLYNAEISEDDAKQIYKVLEPLAHGDFSFGTVAELHSEDTSSDSFGNLGIMDTATSFVNEFKLGIYVYDTLFNDNDPDIEANATEEKDPFNLYGSNNDEFFNNLGINFIPYEAVTRLYKYASQTSDNTGHQINEGSAAYYPRNIIFNTYFNNHNISFITKEHWGLTDDAEAEAQKLVTNEHKGNNGNTYYSDLVTNGTWGDENNYNYTWKNGNSITDETLNGFQTIHFNYDVNGDHVINDDDTKEVLCDENGNPIIVVRAGTSDYQGVHFIVVERSGLDTTRTYTAPNGEDTYTSTLNEYFAAESPIDNDGRISTNAPYVSTTGESNTGEVAYSKRTYINNVVSDYSNYSSRATTLENTIRNYDTVYDYRVFQWLQSETQFEDVTMQITFEGQEPIDITQRITSYVANQIESNADANIIDDDTWDDYVEYLKNQQDQRKSKLIPLTCAIGFSGGYGDENSDLYKVCHYQD